MIIGVGIGCTRGPDHVFRWIGMDTVQCKLCGKRYTGHERDLGGDACLTCKKDHPNK